MIHPFRAPSAREGISDHTERQETDQLLRLDTHASADL